MLGCVPMEVSLTVSANPPMRFYPSGTPLEVDYSIISNICNMHIK
jgi:hypothetical protein